MWFLPQVKLSFSSFYSCEESVRTCGGHVSEHAAHEGVEGPTLRKTLLSARAVPNELELLHSTQRGIKMTLMAAPLAGMEKLKQLSSACRSSDKEKPKALNARPERA